MAQPPLETIGGLPGKNLEAFSKEEDGLITAVHEGFDAMEAVISNDYDHEVSNAPPSFPIEPKEEPIDIDESLPLFREISASEFMRDEKMIKEEEMGNDNSFPIEPKEEPIDIHEHLPQNYHISASELMSDEKMFKEEEIDNENKEGITDNSNSIYSDSLDGAQNSGMDDRIGNFLNEPPFNDHNFARILKKRSSGVDESVIASKKLRVSKTNHTELKCPECEWLTRSVASWIDHLRRKHSTTPALAGLALLCECGHESLSAKHCDKTNHFKTIVIRKRDGPIGRLGDKKATPRCVLCEAYPKTAVAYAQHLMVHHKSNLTKNGIYLLCSCGREVRSTTGDVKHCEDCNPRQFTMRNVDEEKGTVQCILCEAYPRTAHVYALHLELHHNSTLAQNGVYLICSCGLEVRYYDAGLNHLHECNRRQFTLHKLGDE